MSTFHDAAAETNNTTDFDKVQSLGSLASRPRSGSTFFSDFGMKPGFRCSVIAQRFVQEDIAPKEIAPEEIAPEEIAQEEIAQEVPENQKVPGCESRSLEKLLYFATLCLYRIKLQNVLLTRKSTGRNLIHRGIGKALGLVCFLLTRTNFLMNDSIQVRCLGSSQTI